MQQLPAPGSSSTARRARPFTYNAIDQDGTTTQGGYSQAVVVDENYVVRIPDSLPLDAAAPLLCAGITLLLAAAALEGRTRTPGWRSSASAGWATWASSSAHAMGAEVTVLSQSLKKMEDGLRLGAEPLLRHRRPRHLQEACAAAST